MTLLEDGISFVVRGVKNSFSTYVMLTGKEAENRGLIRKISELQQKNNSYAEAVRENERLKKILHDQL